MVRAERHAGDGLFTARRRRANLLRDPTLARIAVGIAAPAAAVALAWTIRNGNVIAFPIRFGGACKGERRRARIGTGHRMNFVHWRSASAQPLECSIWHASYCRVMPGHKSIWQP